MHMIYNMLADIANVIYLDLVHLAEWTTSIGRLTENVFKRISAFSNPDLNPNPKAQKRFR